MISSEKYALIKEKYVNSTDEVIYIANLAFFFLYASSNSFICSFFIHPPQNCILSAATTNGYVYGATPYHPKVFGVYNIRFRSRNL